MPVWGVATAAGYATDRGPPEQQRIASAMVDWRMVGVESSGGIRLMLQ